MTPSRRRNTRARRSGDGTWAMLACGTLGICLVAGVVVQVTIGSPWRGVVALQPQDVLSDEEMIGTGSILFIPFRGNQCQHNLFDNKTGQIWHSGYVSCDIALAKGSGERTKGWSMARTEAIRGSFRWKP